VRHPKPPARYRDHTREVRRGRKLFLAIVCVQVLFLAMLGVFIWAVQFAYDESAQDGDGFDFESQRRIVGTTDSRTEKLQPIALPAESSLPSRQREHAVSLARTTMSYSRYSLAMAVPVVRASPAGVIFTGLTYWHRLRNSGAVP
jgi:hypothetical protein